MTIAEKIVSARKQKGLTQEDLASLSNITVRTIQRIESGESIPRSYTLKAMAKALEVPFDFFVESQAIDATTHSTFPDNSHFIRMLNMSCFTYLIIPFVHFLVPSYMLKKREGLSEQEKLFCKRIIRGQVYWLICTHLAFLVVLILNFWLVAATGEKIHINYLWPLLIMFFINASIIVRNSFRIKQLY